MMLARGRIAVIGGGAALLSLMTWVGASSVAHAHGAAKSDPSHVLLFTDDGANAKLALADEPAALMLECAHGSRTVHVTHAAVENPAPSLTLTSGGVADSITAERQAFEGRTLVLADTTTDAPALSAFRRSGVLKVSYGGGELVAGARPEAFFAACSGRVS